LFGHLSTSRICLRMVAWTADAVRLVRAKARHERSAHLGGFA
jgi:hypothetical protein